MKRFAVLLAGIMLAAAGLIVAPATALATVQPAPSSRDLSSDVYLAANVNLTSISRADGSVRVFASIVNNSTLVTVRDITITYSSGGETVGTKTLASASPGSSNMISAVTVTPTAADFAAGKMTITISATGTSSQGDSWTDEITLEVTLVQTSLDTCTIAFDTLEFTADGEAQGPTATITDGDYTLQAGSDYTLGGTPTATDAGSYTLVINGKGWYSGSKSQDWSIAAAAPESSDSLAVEILTESVEVAAAGDEYQILVKVTNNLGIELAFRLDCYTPGYYTYEPSPSLPPGETTFTLTLQVSDRELAEGSTTVTVDVNAENGPGNEYSAHEKDKTIYFIPPKPSIGDCIITLSSNEFEYSGASQVPTVTVTYGGATLTSGTDYTVTLLSSGGSSISGAVDSGAYTLRIAGTGSYQGSVDKEFTISPKCVTLYVANTEKMYGESDPEFSYTVDGMVERDGVMETLNDVSLSREEGEECASYSITATINAESNPNYAVAVENGTFTIGPNTTPIIVTITGTIVEVPADGDSHTAAGYTATSSFAGYDVDLYMSVSGSWSVTHSELGKYYLGIKEADFANTSVNYPNVTFVVTDGYLWLLATCTLKITYQYADGTEIRVYEKTCVENNEYDVETPAIEHYTADVERVKGTMGNTDVEVTVTYTGDPATITLDLGGGTLDGQTGTIEIPARYGDTIKLPTGIPTLEGYTFVCWRGSEYQPGQDYVVDGDHTLTAVFKKNQPTIPPTGDATPIAPAIVLALLAATFAAVTLAFARKRT